MICIIDARCSPPSPVLLWSACQVQVQCTRLPRWSQVSVGTWVSDVAGLAFFIHLHFLRPEISQTQVGSWKSLETKWKRFPLSWLPSRLSSLWSSQGPLHFILYKHFHLMMVSVSLSCHTCSSTKDEDWNKDIAKFTGSTESSIYICHRHQCNSCWKATLYKHLRSPDGWTLCINQTLIPQKRIRSFSLSITMETHKLGI